MAPPIYYLVGRKTSDIKPGDKLNRELLREVGLADVLADAGPTDIVTSEPRKGPGVKFGTLLYAQGNDGTPPTHWGYYPDEQTWQEVSDKLWIGYSPAEPPGPSDLARKEMYDGYFVVINGQQWIAPTIRRPDGTTELPRKLTLNADGSVSETVKDRYAALWADTAKIQSLYFDGLTLPYSVTLDIALRGLAVNYRIGRHEQNALELIDSESIEGVLTAMVDREAVINAVTKRRNGEQSGMELLDKKKDEDEPLEPPNSSPGTTAETPDTVLAAVK